jgi:hypothetical protein
VVLIETAEEVVEAVFEELGEGFLGFKEFEFGSVFGLGF